LTKVACILPPACIASITYLTAQEPQRAQSQSFSRFGKKNEYENRFDEAIPYPGDEPAV
jgi:hypothetical protein